MFKSVTWFYQLKLEGKVLEKIDSGIWYRIAHRGLLMCWQVISYYSLLFSFVTDSCSLVLARTFSQVLPNGAECVLIVPAEVAVPLHTTITKPLPMLSVRRLLNTVIRVTR